MTRHRHSKKRCQQLVGQKIRILRHEGYEHDQAVVIAFDDVRKRHGCRIPKPVG